MNSETRTQNKFFSLKVLLSHTLSLIQKAIDRI